MSGGSCGGRDLAGSESGAVVDVRGAAVHAAVATGYFSRA